MGFLNRNRVDTLLTEQINTLIDIRNHNQFPLSDDKQILIRLNDHIKSFSNVLKQIEDSYEDSVKQNSTINSIVNMENKSDYEKIQDILERTITQDEPEEIVLETPPTEDFDINNTDVIILPEKEFDYHQDRFNKYNQRVQKVLAERAGHNPTILMKLMEENPNIKGYINGTIKELI